MGLYLDMLAFLSPSRAGALGFRLFCRPFRPPLRSNQLAFLETAERSTLTIEGTSVQLYKWGSGEKKVLFLHGWQSHTYRWRSYIEALPPEEYTLYSLDAPGHGLSSGNFLSVPLYSDLIHKAVQELGAFHAVVGHSLGAFSLLYTFYRFPLLPVARVILLAPPGEATDFVNVFKQTLGISRRTLAHIEQQFVDRYQTGPDFFSSARFSGSLNVPGLIIHDEEDREAPYHYSLRMNRIWKKSRLVTTNGLGHNLRSSAVVREVTAFIARPLPSPVEAPVVHESDINR